MDNRQNVHRSLGGEFAGLRSSSPSRVQWRNESKKRANGNNRSFCAGPCLNRLRSGGGEPPRHRPRCILESRRDLESILRGGEKEEEEKKKDRSKRDRSIPLFIALARVPLPSIRFVTRQPLDTNTVQTSLCVCACVWLRCPSGIDQPRSISCPWAFEYQSILQIEFPPVSAERGIFSNVKKEGDMKHWFLKIGEILK